MQDSGCRRKVNVRELLVCILGRILRTFSCFRLWNFQNFVLKIVFRFRRVISKFILALSDGYFYPCMIMRPTTDGYVVYFFYLKEEREIPSNVIIGNLWYLINCEVSFTDINGNIATGRIVGTDFKSTDTDREQPMNFFIYCNDACRTISFPYIFLSTQQARMLCG